MMKNWITILLQKWDVEKIQDNIKEENMNGYVYVEKIS